MFPIQEMLKGHSTVGIRRDMERSQWWPRHRIEAYQLARLQRFLEEVSAHVPYYRDLFEQVGFKPDQLKGVGDLGRLPFLTKPLIRQHSDALRSERARGLARFNTGGSSGEPLIFFIGTQRVSHDVAAKWRATRWWDVDIGDREIVVWGSPIELGSQDRVRWVRDTLMRTELLPAFEMSDARVDEFVERIRMRQPKMLFGYPSAISHIAKRAEQSGKRLDDVGIKVVFCTSERLYDHQRDVIETLFGCPVANGYGGRDAGFIAHQCPHGSMHITAEDIVVEIVDEQGQVVPPGVSGEIVVTHLATSDYPFIRYRTGDVGTLTEEVCECGRGLPVLKDIQGRATDFIVAADGTVMHGLSLIYILRDLPEVQSFKIVQESVTRIKVLIVTSQGSDQRDMADHVDAEFKRRLGQEVEVVCEFVGEIPPEKSGKFRYVISHVATR